MLPPDRKLQNKLALLRGLALVPLLIYPAVLLAGLMAIAAPGTGSIHSLSDAVAFLFIYGSLLYPVTVGLCLVVNRRRRSLRIAAIPLWHLAIVVALGVVWWKLS